MYWVKEIAANRTFLMWCWGVRGVEVYFSPMIRPQPFSKPIISGLWTSQVFLNFLIPLQARKDGYWAWLGYFPSPCGRLEPVGIEYFLPPVQVRLWLTSFLWGQALLRIEFSGLFQNVSSSLALLEARGDSPPTPIIYCGNLIKLLEVNLTILWSTLDPALPHDWLLLEFFTFIVVHAELSKIRQLQVRFSYPSTGSCGSFPHKSLLRNDAISVFICLSDLGNSSLPCVLLFLMDLRRIVVFQPVQVFSCC